MNENRIHDLTLKLESISRLELIYETEHAKEAMYQHKQYLLKELIKELEVEKKSMQYTNVI